MDRPNEEWLRKMAEQEHFAQVEMFGRELTCKVTAVGKPMDKYPRNRTLWIERAEDEYAKPHYVPPFCLLYRDDWMAARKLFEASDVQTSTTKDGE